ncbi:MAG: H-NS histone family protein [Burkholderiales bacterium]|nr:H-NS histone family protein [Burkholderiales bacterium]
MPTYRELQEQAQKLLEQAEALRVKEMNGALDSIVKTMGEFGISLEELFDHLKASGFKPKSQSAAKAKAKTKVEAKYRDPASGATWSGRGRTPGWLREAEERGKSREKFLIK